MAGEVLGSYQLLERLGSGGFATVYKAVPLRGGPSVAIKVLRQEYAEDPEFLRRFQREAEIAISLPDNPHIAKPLEFRIDAGTPYLVLEYLDGKDLSELLQGGRRLPASDVISIAVQVAQALQTAHQRRVVHRDIKPQNIRITSGGIVKVMDFGIARPATATRLTQTGTFVGTPSYIPPEVWEGRPADERSDIYALGVVMYEALAGLVPFGADTPAAIMRQHLYGQIQPLTSLRKDLPGGLESIVQKAMARDPAHRFQSAGALFTALRTPERPVVLASTPGSVGSLSPSSAPTGIGWHRFSAADSSPIPQGYLIGHRSQFSLRPNATVIGRDPRSDIALNDRLLSNNHARVELRDGRYVLHDLGSDNGTYVNGKRIQTATPLRNGDKIQVGQASFTFMQFPASPGAHPVGSMTARDDNVWAGICHASALFTIANVSLPLVPAAAPLAIWLIARRTSAYVGFHAKQAFLFQALVVLVLMVAAGRYLALVWLIATGYALFGAFRCYRGLSFKYPILGDIAATWR